VKPWRGGGSGEKNGGGGKSGQVKERRGQGRSGQKLGMARKEEGGGLMFDRA